MNVIRSDLNVPTMQSEVALTINGTSYKVSSSLSVDTSLNEFIRTIAHLKGTKFMCLEGGCGACIVTAKRKDATTGKEYIFAVNSCLTPIFACHGWSVTTIEGIGSKATGYNEIQSRLASFNGSQCGFCSPGMVMNMYSLVKGNEDVFMKTVENSFGGNICRCTGYRPILDAFKSLCTDAPKVYHPDLCSDIEDFPRLCLKTEEICSQACSNKNRCLPEESIEDDFDLLYVENLSLMLSNDVKWYKVDDKKQIFEIFDMIDDFQSYQLVAGNTARGAYRTGDFDYYIDINSVAELSDWILQDNALILGSNITLTKTMNIFERISQKYPRFSYLKVFADHIDLVANVPIRNVGTLAGNLSLKNQHPEFPSDIYLLFVLVRALYVEETSMGTSDTKFVEELIATSLRKKLITCFILPALDDSYIIKTYKIMPCAQNAKAIVNAGFKIKLSNKDALTVSEATIVFGGITPNYVHAEQTQNYLVGKSLSDSQAVQGALDKLDYELHPNFSPPDASPIYRKRLAQSLFYKFILSLKPGSIQEKYRSGGETLQRPRSSGKQSFTSDRKLWPVNKAIPKLEAYSQCSGEAEYTNDIPSLPGELFGALVLAPAGPGTLDSIDTSVAMRLNGVKSFFSAKNIPGINIFTPPGEIFSPDTEPVFADKYVTFSGQPVGIMVAETQLLANKAAGMVRVNVTNLKKPLLTPEEVLDSGDQSRVRFTQSIERKAKKGSGKHIIKGSFECREQYHFHMETQTCLAVPTDEGIDLYPSSQYLSTTQRAISLALKLPENCINVQNRRVGGGYGGKLSRMPQIAIPCALGAFILRKPVRIVLSIESNMQAIGKRTCCLSTYEVSVDDEGKVQYLDMNIHQDLGSSFNDNTIPLTLQNVVNCYDSSTWKVDAYAVRTDKSSNTYCRAPGACEGIATIEHVFEHIATELKKDPLVVRATNFADDSKEHLGTIIDQLKESSDFDNRKKKIQKFNGENRWRKQGISITPMRFALGLFGNFHVLVSIYQSDGSVSITHGGIEMGQGINTKAAQVCAYKFEIDVEMVKIKPSNVLTAPNDFGSVNSMTSDSVCQGVIICCDILLERLSPIKAKLSPDAKWQEVIAAAAVENIDLCAIHMYTIKDIGEKNDMRYNTKTYNIFGACVTEVEVDILTGKYLILRTDIIEDAGVSLNPELDVGQVEGAFVLGLGYWLTEDIIFDCNTGKVLTDRTWNYKPPGFKDIPCDFRVTILKNYSDPNGSPFFLRSKATGEPPLCMSCGVMFALRQAINASRCDAGKPDDWCDISVPFSPEKVFLAAFTGTQEYKLG
nr:PREDICTED: xanthine dehydrogenase-like [Bemisia tabaci]